MLLPSLSTIATLGILVTSLPTLYLTFTSARLFSRYEDVTKKAAKYSREAGRQLHKTRTTQGSAVAASLVSTVSAMVALVAGSGTPQAIYVCNAISCFAVWKYVNDFWGNTARVPLPGSREYNDAVRTTERALSFLIFLGLGWAGVAVVKGLGL